MDQIWKIIEEQISQPGGLRHWLLWFSSLLCFVVSYLSARRVRENPRLFTVLALFAAAWVLAMSAIESRVHAPGITSVADRAYDIAALLLVFSGTTLAREAPPGHVLVLMQRWVQVAGLWLLFVLVLPSQLPIKLPLPDQTIELVIGEVLSGVSFLALALGARAVSHGVVFWSLVVLVLVYESLSLSRTVDLLSIAPGAVRPFMELPKVSSFILLRFLLTGLYCYIVLMTFGQKSSPGSANGSKE
jgi:hypothetical protein